MIKKKKLNSKQLVIYCRQMGDLLGADVPLRESLSIVADGFDGAQRKTIKKVLDKVNVGESLSMAMEKQSRAFGSGLVRIVHLGEKSDRLAEVLKLYAKGGANIEASFEEAFRNMMEKLFYIMAVLVVAVTIGSVLMIFVIPQFESLFNEMGSELPQLTQYFVYFSHWLHDWWWLAIGSLILTVGLFSYAFNHVGRIRSFLFGIIFYVPGIRKLINEWNTARFAQLMAILIKFGESVPSALEASADSIDVAGYKSKITQLREDVLAGESLYQSMQKQDLFTRQTRQAVRICERVNQLSEAFEDLARFSESRLKQLSKEIGESLTSIGFLLTGTLVGTLVMAMYLPIFKLAAVF